MKKKKRHRVIRRERSPVRGKKKGSQKEVTSGPQPAEGGVGGGGVARAQVGVEPAASCAFPRAAFPAQP